MISNSLQGASNKDEIQVTGHEFRVRGSPGNELFAELTRQGVQLFVPQFECSREIEIALCKSSHAITKNRYRHPISRLQQGDFAHRRSAVQTLRPSRDGGGLVSNTFQICTDLHRRNNLPHIGGNRMEPNQQTDPVLIDLLLKNVDLFVFCNDMVAKLAIAI